VRRRDTINNQSTAREFEDGKQIFAAFNGGLKPGGARVGFTQAKLCHPLRGLCRLSLLHSHSLRCGLEEFRQLRWLNIPNPRDFRRTFFMTIE
jgi:hypothetical protein